MKPELSKDDHQPNTIDSIYYNVLYENNMFLK